MTDVARALYAKLSRLVRIGRTRLFEGYRPNTRATIAAAGVDIAMSDHAALVKLLVAKGVVTMDEVESMMANELRDTVTRMEEDLSKRSGEPVNLEVLKFQ